MLNEQTKFSLSIGRIIVIGLAVVGGAFTFGMAYQQIIPDRMVEERQTRDIEDIKVTLSRVTTILENMEKNQEEYKREIAALQSKTHVMNAEVQLISAKLK